MPADRLLAQLEDAKRKLGQVKPSSIERIIRALARTDFRDPLSLARFHDVVLFLRAFPPAPSTLKLAERVLPSFAARVQQLRDRGTDLSAIEDDEAWSGIAGSTLTAFLGFDEVAWLNRRFPGQIEIDWDSYENAAQMGYALPRFVPLLEEDARVEADVPYRQWLQAASRGRDVEWLIEQIQRMPATPDERVELFASLQLPIRWRLGNSRASRTSAKQPVRRIFFHREALIQRRDVSLLQELAQPPVPLEKLSTRAGRRMIDFCREATTVRYRELYGTSLGDPASVVRAPVGRGVEIFLWGLLRERRLPQRAYQAGFTLKNGVPINYIEGIALFEWMEIGFNTFYAYREGETAWVYAQALRMLRQVLGVTCISVYPYQLGKDNEEAIGSGAFWFYRKLGFRPMRAELARLAASEERKIAADRAHRTSATILRRLAEGHVVLELPGSEPGAWDGFAMRNIGFAIQRRMAQQFGGDASRIREAMQRQVAKALGVTARRWPALEQKAFADLALLWGMIPNLSRFPESEKRLLLQMIRAKASGSEGQYLALQRRAQNLRAGVLRLGYSGR